MMKRNRERDCNQLVKSIGRKTNSTKHHLSCTKQGFQRHRCHYVDGRFLNKYFQTTSQYLDRRKSYRICYNLYYSMKKNGLFGNCMDKEAPTTPPRRSNRVCSSQITTPEIVTPPISQPPSYPPTFTTPQITKF